MPGNFRFGDLYAQILGFFQLLTADLFRLKVLIFSLFRIRPAQVMGSPEWDFIESQRALLPENSGICLTW